MPTPASRIARSWSWPLLLLCLWGGVAAHVAGWQALPGVASVTRKLSDALQSRAAPPAARAASTPVVIVDIDERSLRQVGHWPWPREAVAALLAQLLEAKAKVVGLDMVFPEAEVGEARLGLERLAQERPAIAAVLKAEGPAVWDALDGDRLLAGVMQGSPVCAGLMFENAPSAPRVGSLNPGWAWPQAKPAGWPAWPGHTANLAELAQAARCGGAFNAEVDTDGVLRRVPLLFADGERLFPALSLAMVREGTGRDPLAATAITAAAQPPSLTIVFDGAGGPSAGRIPYFSAVDVLQGRVGAAQLSDRYVLVGTTASGLNDLRATPVAPLFPGVELHAMAIGQMLRGEFPSPAPLWGQMLLVVALAAACVWVLPRCGPLAGLLLTLGMAVALMAWQALCWRQGLKDWPVGAPLLALLLTAGLQWLRGYWWEGRQRRALKSLFGAYVSPERVEEMAKDPERYGMEARNEVLTVMFCDLRNFTSLSETLAPHELRELINLFLSRMSQEIAAHGGTVDKFIGDAVMAFWGAPMAMPAHAAAAGRCALAMSRAVKALNQQLHRDPRWQAKALPEIGMGVGLHTGLMCVGDMGATHRRAYTVLGDAVNLAARVEGLTRHYGVDVLVTQDTLAAAAAHPEDGMPALQGMWVDRVRVKGKTQAVELMALFDEATEKRPGTEEMREWEAVLRAYHQQNWEDGQLKLEALVARWPASPLQPLYQLYALRIQRFRQNPPPPGWDGCHDHLSK